MRLARQATLREGPMHAVPAIAVLGLGNILLCDEGVGVHALHALENGGGCPPGTQFVDGGTVSFALASYLQDCEALIVFDAAEFGGRPGDVRLFEGAAMDTFLGSNRRHTVHEVSLLDLMAVAALSDRLPARRALIAIQPESFDWSDTPSPSVAAALPVACAEALRVFQSWRLL